MKPDIQYRLDELNEILSHGWLISKVDRLSHNPPRDPKDHSPLGVDPAKCEKMDRFIFQGDCFTSLDGRIAPDGTGFTIIHNAHLKGNYLEDGAFSGPAWARGRFIPWELMKLAASYYVALSMSRMRVHYHKWPPKPLMKDAAVDLEKDCNQRREAGIPA